MAMGVSSYSGKPARIRKPHPIRISLPRIRIPGIRLELSGVRHIAEMLAPWVRVASYWLRWPVSILAVAHLLLALVLPGGGNALLGIKPESGPAYLTWLRPPDALGFAVSGEEGGFFVYKIYTEGGDVVEGAFPGHEVAPRLRMDRYTMAGEVATSPYPVLHERVGRYILDHLPSPPLRLELFAARWVWDRDTLSTPWNGRSPQLTMKLHLVGTYNGLTEDWQPTLNVTDQR